MNFEANHISVCVCTYRRPTLLLRLLESLSHQQICDPCTFSIVVADNDIEQSARDVVTKFAEKSPFPVHYGVEHQRNIALARNKAIEMAQGEFIAFIDDDEFPAEGWLTQLRQACDKPWVAGVLGPVKPHFDTNPPSWIIKGGFCNRPEHATGTVLRWWQGRTGNLLFRQEILRGVEPAFRPEFGAGGEDQDFFLRMMDRGYIFTWCNEAVAYEIVPPARWTRSYMLKRALLRGRNGLKHARGRWLAVGKSVVAIPLYLLSLPLMLLGGHHRFMKNSIRLCDHLGRILTLLRINPVSEREI